MIVSFDHSVLLFIYGLAMSSSFTQNIAIFFASWFPYIVICSGFIYIFYAEGNDQEIRRSLLRTISALIITLVVVEVMKYTIQEGRPFTGDSGIMPLISVFGPYASFPSFHAAVFSALAGALFGNRFRRWYWFLLSAVLIAVARVAVGVHWPSDIFVGLVLGFAIGFFITRPLVIAGQSDKKTTQLYTK